MPVPPAAAKLMSRAIALRAVCRLAEARANFRAALQLILDATMTLHFRQHLRLDQVRVSELWAIAATLALLLGVVAALSTTYVGHSSSPYGVCYASSGRAIPCDV